MIINAKEFIELKNQYENAIKANEDFAKTMYKTIFNYMKINNINKIDVRNTFLERPVEIDENNVVKLKITNIILHDGRLLLHYEKFDIVEDFKLLTPTEYFILYIVIFSDGISELEKKISIINDIL